jgi:hypothetical protein
MIMRKTFIVLATISLAIAIVVPTTIFLYNSNLNQSNIIVTNPNGQVTDGNTTAAQGIKLPQGINNALPVAIGIVFFSLFAIFGYIGLKPTKSSSQPLFEG